MEDTEMRLVVDHNNGYQAKMEFTDAKWESHKTRKEGWLWQSRKKCAVAAGSVFSPAVPGGSGCARVLL